MNYSVKLQRWNSFSAHRPYLSAISTPSQKIQSLFSNVNVNSPSFAPKYSMSMELRRVANALLRSQGSPLTALLTPSVATRWTAGSQLSYKLSYSGEGRRTFVSTARKNASFKPRPTTRAPEPELQSPQQNSPSDLDESLAKTLNVGAPMNPESVENPLDIATSLGWARKVSKARASPSEEMSSKDIMDGGTSAANILAAISEQREQRVLSPFTADQKQKINLDLMQSWEPGIRVGAPSPSSGGVENILDQVDSRGKVKKAVRPPMALKPLTGRSIAVAANVDVGRAFRLMEQSCARNRIRSDATKQRFHERPGMKRKRLRRERWRKKFMEGFKATVGRVKQLRHQGW